MHGNIRKENIKKLLIMVAAFLVIVITVLSSSYVIADELMQQLQQNLEDVANQNALAFYNKVHSNHQLLEGLSENLHHATPETIEDTLQSFSVFVDKYDLKRFAMCFPDGSSYSTDGGTANLSYREFFQRGMEGKGTITDVLADALDENHELVNVMTIPVFDENGNVESVFGLTYRSAIFNDVLQVHSFDGQGYSCVINEDGQILAAQENDELHLTQNLFSDVLSAEEQNAGEIEKLQEQMKQKTAGSGTLYLTEKNYYYCMPVELLDGDIVWYMLTLVPSKVLESRIEPIQRNLYLMSFFVVVLTLIGVFLLVLLSREHYRTQQRFLYEDPLTKGANYAKFCMDMKKRRIGQGYLIIMDITNFNNINIAAGMTEGNKIIRDIWEILTGVIQSNETAGHVREDVFILCLQESDRERLLERIRQISDEISKRTRTLQIQGIHTRYGIYYMDGTETLEDAYSKAQIAREYARTQREKRYAFYSEIDHEKRREDEQLEERFEEALEGREFEVWYQPKYSAATGEMVGSEALVRWKSKDGSMISPGRFIPLFEQNGMIARLDEYMFRAVCEQQARWLTEVRQVRPVSINLSRASLYYVDIVERYQAILEEFHLDARYIELEVTESAMEGKADIRALLERFRSLGIQILIDDFGTGYSSLATLNMRCFDVLKLDKSLIDHIGDKNGETLLYFVINMGQQLGLHITAEGVENQMQLEYLQQVKCDVIQGFFFARPMLSVQFEEFL